MTAIDERPAVQRGKDVPSASPLAPGQSRDELAKGVRDKLLV